MQIAAPVKVGADSYSLDAELLHQAGHIDPQSHPSIRRMVRDSAGGVTLAQDASSAQTGGWDSGGDDSDSEDSLGDDVEAGMAQAPAPFFPCF